MDGGDESRLVITNGDIEPSWYSSFVLLALDLSGSGPGYLPSRSHLIVEAEARVTGSWLGVSSTGEEAWSLGLRRLPTTQTTAW